MIDLSLLDKSKTNAIIIRHADRDDMMQNQIEQPLNETGKQNAIALGEKLRGFKNYVFFSSPVDRCQQSAQFIQEGIGLAENKNSLSEILGRPGPFVVNRKENAFKTTGCKTVVEKQIAHEKLEGIRETSEGVKIFMNFVLDKMRSCEDGTLLVFITHDAIIGPVIFELTGEKFNHEHWPEFSDGFIVEKSGDEYKVIRSGIYFFLGF